MKMKIILLDEPVYLTKDLLVNLKKLGSVDVFYDKPSKEVAIQRLNGSDIAIVRWTMISRDILFNLNRVKYIILAGTGFPKIDISAAKEKGIVVSNVPNYCQQSVAEHVFALVLALNKHIISSSVFACKGENKPHPLHLGFELYEKTLGIVGLGHIGTSVARIGMGFGMKVLGNARSKKTIPGVQFVDLDTLLSESDIVSLNVDLNETSRGLLCLEKLKLMKKSAYLISTTNSAVIDENALLMCLQEKRLAGAGIDSSCINPQLRSLSNVLLTPSSAWYTKESLFRLGEAITQNISNFIDGKHVNELT